MRLAICIISYNRPDSLRRVLSSVENGFYDDDTVDLIISIDYSGSKSVENVASDFKWEHGKKRIITHHKNLGLRKHVLKCGQFTQEYDGVIVLEDDIYVAQSFYYFAKACVSAYADDMTIAGISLYSFGINYHDFLPFTPLSTNSDVYMMQNAQSWGQVWMPKQWNAFMDWYSVNDEDFPEMPHLPKSICSWKKSWLKYHTRFCIECNKYFVYPYISLSTCFSDEGEHTSNTSTLIQVPLLYGVKKEFKLNPSVIYDSFFENLSFSEFLKINPDDLCVDIYGEKQNRENKRFWLTRQVCDYKIISQFGLNLKPIELNILQNVRGSDIFLYDTSVCTPNPCVAISFRFERYLLNTVIGGRKLLKMGLQSVKSRFGF